MKNLSKGGIKPQRIEKGISAYEIRQTESIYNEIYQSVLNLCSIACSHNMPFDKIVQINFLQSKAGVLIRLEVDNG